MLNALRKRLDREDDGFTLIELMVVVLIIAILIAIAIPTFLGAQDRARDRSAQSDLRNSLTAAKTLATDSEGLFQTGGANITAADMNSAEPSITHVAMASASTDGVGVVVAGTGASITLATESASGDWFCISSTSQGVVTYGSGDALTAVDTAGECSSTSPW